MARKLTKKQKDFADKYLETGNATQAIKESYNVTTDLTAGAMGSENLRKPKVIEYLQSKSSAVASKIFDLAMNAQNESVQLSASKDILDRAGYKPVDKSIKAIVDERKDAVIDVEVKEMIKEVEDKAYKRIVGEDE